MRYVKESRIAAPPETVFAFHEQPGAFESLVPPWERVEIISGGGGLLPGSRVVVRTRVGPVWLRWVAMHTEYQPPEGFTDRQESGPFTRWEHRHRFLPDGAGGTILRDEIEFEPRGGLVGRLLLGPLVRRKLDRLFEYRHEVTHRALADDAPGRS